MRPSLAKPKSADHNLCTEADLRTTLTHARWLTRAPNSFHFWSMRGVKSVQDCKALAFFILVREQATGIQLLVEYRWKCAGLLKGRPGLRFEWLT